MAALSDSHNFLVAQENHAEQMKDIGTVEPDIKDMPPGNEKVAEAKDAGAAKKSRKTKKEEDKRGNFLNNSQF